MTVREKWPGSRSGWTSLRPSSCAARSRARRCCSSRMLSDPASTRESSSSPSISTFSSGCAPCPKRGCGEWPGRSPADRGGRRGDVGGGTGGALREIRTAAATAAGLPADPETLLGPDGEVPREVRRNTAFGS